MRIPSTFMVNNFDLLRMSATQGKKETIVKVV